MNLTGSPLSHRRCRKGSGENGKACEVMQPSIGAATPPLWGVGCGFPTQSPPVTLPILANPHLKSAHVEIHEIKLACSHSFVTNENAKGVFQICGDVCGSTNDVCFQSSPNPLPKSHHWDSQTRLILTNAPQGGGSSTD